MLNANYIAAQTARADSLDAIRDNNFFNQLITENNLAQAQAKAHYMMGNQYATDEDKTEAMDALDEAIAEQYRVRNDNDQFVRGLIARIAQLTEELNEARRK